MHSRCKISDVNTQTLSGPLTLIRSLWCLEGQMVVVGIGAPGLTPLPIVSGLALGYGALMICAFLVRLMLRTAMFCRCRRPAFDDMPPVFPKYLPCFFIKLTPTIGMKYLHITSSWHTVYPKKYAHGFCFAVLCCGYTLTDFPISIRFTSLALWQSNDVHISWDIL